MERTVFSFCLLGDRYTKFNGIKHIEDNPFESEWIVIRCDNGKRITSIRKDKILWMEESYEKEN
jgi:hypothetical protein